MNCNRKRKNLCGGFTLLEIMVAITILSFVFGVVYTTFATISESEKKISLSADISEKARNLLEYITRDISSTVVPEQIGTSPAADKQAKTIYGFRGVIAENGFTKIDFTTAGPDTGNARYTSIQEVGYYLLPSDSGGFRLMKRIDPTPDGDITEGGRSFELMGNLDSMKIEFLNHAGEWLEEWVKEEKERLPRAIKIDISFLPGDGEDKEFFTTLSPIYQGRKY